MGAGATFMWDPALRLSAIAGRHQEDPCLHLSGGSWEKVGAHLLSPGLFGEAKCRLGLEVSEWGRTGLLVLPLGVCGGGICRLSSSCTSQVS